MHTMIESLRKALVESKRVLLATHINPDGDAIGSVAALARIARHFDCDVRILLISGVPDYLSWLPLAAPWVKKVEELGSFTPDLVIAADCGDAQRTGDALAAFFLNRILPAPAWSGAVTANIDHHTSNPHFADINWVEPARASTSELVGLLAEHLGILLAGELGEAVYLGLVSDTGNFTFSNTSAEAFALAARIVQNGLDIAEFTNKADNIWSLPRMRLWGRLLTEITLHGNGAVACSIVPRRYLDELNLGHSCLEGYASWLRRLKGVRVGLFIREDAPGICKISLRSMGDLDVQQIAAVFGGGGHKAAAGAELKLGPEETATEVLKEIEARL